MEPRQLEVGDVVQLNPERVLNKALGGCFAIVDEPKNFGAQVGIAVVGRDRNTPPSVAFYRAGFAEMEFIGKAVFLPSFINLT